MLKNCSATDEKTESDEQTKVTSDISDSSPASDVIHLTVYIPEIQNEQTIICSPFDAIWSIKCGLLERCNNLKCADLNYGFFCVSFGHFLDEELTLLHYFRDIIRKCCNRIRLEFLYKQRCCVGQVMSTMPTATTARRRRKRTRLMTAVTNGNVEKIAKLLSNCDPNFVDETSGDSPLSVAATSQSTTTSLVQRVIVALVNGGALLDFRTKDGRTALHCAVQKSNYVALKTLLDMDFWGNFIERVRTLRLRPKIPEYHLKLSQNGASPNYRDGSGLTSLWYTIVHQSNPKLTQLLLHEHSIHGVTDQHGWREVHHTCKLGLVAHLEQLLYYGCDMNCKIVGSGNTPLHVAAINDQLDCARVLLLRGCNTSVVNNSHQNAYQVAVISGNMQLAELIAGFKQEMVQPYRDRPKYNPSRRPIGDHRQNTAHNEQMNGPHVQQHPPASPCLSQRSCATSTATTTTTSSSGVCCEDGSQSEGADEESDTEDESSSRPSQLLPGMTVQAVADYTSGDPTHLQLRRGDVLLLMQNNHSPPTIANQKLLLGRRCTDGREGLFPTCCVEKVKMRVEGRREKKYAATTLPARGRSSGRNILKESGNINFYHERTVTLHRGQKGFGFVLRGAKATSPLMKQTGSSGHIGLQYLDEIESSGVADVAGLKRGDFLLAVNGADVRQMSHEAVVQLIRQSGDKVTMTVATPVPQKKQLISILKKDTDKLKGVAKCRDDESDDSCQLSTSLPSSSPLSANLSHKYSTLPRNTLNCSSMISSVSSTGASDRSASSSRGRAPPAPPKRDPTTTLSIGRARARSLLLQNAATGQTANTMTRSEMTAGSEYDSEGRSTKSSSPTTSIESMIMAQKNNTLTNNAANKIASIRSRSSRRISAFELEEFFARQSDGTDPTTKTFESVAALKKKKHKKLHKNFNSTPDLQAQLMEQMQRKTAKTLWSNWSNSQDDLKCYHMYAETLPLRGGKFIPSAELSTNFDGNKPSSRAPPPSHPPPPPPPPASSSGGRSVVTVTLTKKIRHQQDDYANFETMEQNQQQLSSFRPSDTIPDAPVIHKSKAPAPPPPQTVQSTLRSVKHPAAGASSTASLYTRQETIEPLEDLNNPQIPDPDYSTDDDDVVVNRDLSTFKSTPQEASVDEQKIVSESTKVVPQNQSVPSSKKPVMPSGDEIIAQSERINSKSMTTSVSSSESSAIKSKKLNEQIAQEIDHQKDQNEGSKVKKNIREFERRSSICGENGTVQTVTAKPEVTAVKDKQNGNMRMSKSCFEVDCCDNSSSGVSSDVDGDYHQQSGHATGNSTVQVPVQTQNKQQIQTLNRRNSAIVSEKIANLIAATQIAPSPVPSSKNSSTSSVSIPLPSQKPVAVHQLQSQRSSMSMTEDKKPIAKVASSPVPTSGKVQPSPAGTTKTVTFSLTQVKTEPSKGIATQTPPKVQQSTATPTPPSVKTSSSSGPIRLQIDSLGLAAVNEVDVLAELVPPPPEFAAPPPGHGSAQQRGLQEQQRIHQQQQEILQHHLQRQQQLKQQQQQVLYQQQILQQKQRQRQQSPSPSSVPPPIPSQPPPATLPHQKEQIRILSPTPQFVAGYGHSHQQIRVQRPASTGTPPPPPPPPPEFSDIQHNHYPHQLPSAALRLGVREQQIQMLRAKSPSPSLGNSNYHHPLHQQQFATLSRSSPSQSMVSSATMLQQQQFATLTRQQHQALRQQQNYSDYTRLTVQNRLMKQNSPSPVTAGAHQVMVYQPIFLRRPLLEWTAEDVSEWLQCIGMGEHRPKFEFFNGAKLMRLDNNTLLGVGIRQPQHRGYILEKLHQQQQKWHHPMNAH